MGRLVFSPTTTDGDGNLCRLHVGNTIFCGKQDVTIMPRHGKYLSLVMRFIDNIIGTFVGDPSRMEWKEFEKDVSNFGILTWTPLKPVNFFDLTIPIEENKIITKT